MYGRPRGFLFFVISAYCQDYFPIRSGPQPLEIQTLHGQVIQTTFSAYLYKVITENSDMLQKSINTYKSNAMKKLEHALSEGLVDEGVISVINSFNSHPDIFTTSSCAGRIQLIILPDIGRKDSVQRRKTWHREVTSEEVMEAISDFDILHDKVMSSP